jgi:hypothetical protein
LVDAVFSCAEPGDNITFDSNIWQMHESYSTRSSYYVPPRGTSAEDNMLQTVASPRYTEAIDEATALEIGSFRFRLRYFNLNSCLATATLIQIPRPEGSQSFRTDKVYGSIVHGGWHGGRMRAMKYSVHTRRLGH